MLPSAFSTTSSAFGFFSPITSMAPYTIFSATDFLPLYMTMLMKRAIVSLPCLGSGRTERCGVLPLRDMFDVPKECFYEAIVEAIDQDFGRLAPYFERDWRRLATPAASS